DYLSFLRLVAATDSPQRESTGVVCNRRLPPLNTDQPRWQVSGRDRISGLANALISPMIIERIEDLGTCQAWVLGDLFTDFQKVRPPVRGQYSCQLLRIDAPSGGSVARDVQKGGIEHRVELLAQRAKFENVGDNELHRQVTSGCLVLGTFDGGGRPIDADYGVATRG